MEAANAGFSISPPLYYPLARSWEGREVTRLHYIPHCRLTRDFPPISPDYRISTGFVRRARFRSFWVLTRAIFLFPFLFFFFFTFASSDTMKLARVAYQIANGWSIDRFFLNDNGGGDINVNWTRLKRKSNSNQIKKKKILSIVTKIKLQKWSTKSSFPSGCENLSANYGYYIPVERLDGLIRADRDKIDNEWKGERERERIIYVAVYPTNDTRDSMLCCGTINFGPKYSWISRIAREILLTSSLLQLSPPLPLPHFPLQNCKHLMPSDYTFDRQIYGTRSCVRVAGVPLISNLNTPHSTAP